MNKFNMNDAEALKNPYKIGLISSIDDEGDVHISLITSLMNKDDDKVMFGEFIEGESKRFIYERPEVGFFIMGLDKKFWTGKAKFTHKVTEGDDYAMYNEMTLFRYNTYCGVSVVHYGDLLDITEKQPLNMAGVVANALRTIALKGTVAGDKNKQVLRPWAVEMINNLLTLKFISFKGKDGIPKIVPIVQAQSPSSDRIAFTKAPYSKMFDELEDGARVAVYALTLDMQGVEVKGTFHNGSMCYVDIDKVYNPVPPKVGYVYPELKQGPINWDDEPLVENLK